MSFLVTFSSQLYEQVKTFKESQESNIHERQYPTEISQPREISKAERRNRTAVKRKKAIVMGIQTERV